MQALDSTVYDCLKNNLDFGIKNRACHGWSMQNADAMYSIYSYSMPGFWVKNTVQYSIGFYADI